jgi:rhodanese-related sulfurtransferase
MAPLGLRGPSRNTMRRRPNNTMRRRFNNTMHRLPRLTHTGRAGGPLPSSSMSTPVDSMQSNIDPQQLAEWMDRDADLQVVDVRESYEREAGFISGSRHIPLVELSSRAQEIERERPVVFYCRVGARSDMAAQAFRASGLEAFSMRGGLVRWASENRPLSPEGGIVADH